MPGGGNIRAATVNKRWRTYNAIRVSLGYKAVPDINRQQHINRFFASNEDFVLRVAESWLDDILGDRFHPGHFELHARRKRANEVIEWVRNGRKEARGNGNPGKFKAKDRLKRLLALYRAHGQEYSRKRVFGKFEDEHLIDENTSTFDEHAHLAEQLGHQQRLLKAAGSATTVTRVTAPPGFVYVAVSPTFPEWVKIGSTLNLQDRLSTFNVHTPHADFQFAFFQYFPDRVKAEQDVHAILDNRRGKGEWFNMPTSEARETILDYHNQKFPENAVA